ncbi:unnamed protein product [Macrosiphum euphorbiae]|uniref:Transposase n=1 Tax=Macrosiphum euphorbiae TaxID=13131 RepID=A0AAV0X4X3_9HEMI|nr:unnamed protein product [Macrosiphum euphorbiae]
MPKIKLISTSISSNSNLKTHIKHVHPSELITFNELGKRKSYNNNNCTQPKKQLKLSEVGKTVKNLSQTEFDKANLELIINTVSPFSLIEHPAFIKYCHLTSNKVPMSRRRLMRNVSSLFNDMIQQLKTELEKIEYVCITADCWSIFHNRIWVLQFIG